MSSMKNKMLILKFIPMIVLMVIIFIYSNMPGDESSVASNSIADKIAAVVENVSGYQMSEDSVAVLNKVIRKGAHFTEYAILAVTIMFPLSDIVKNKKKLFLLSFLIAAGYATSDEIHQYFVPGRSAKIADVLIDSSGGLTGLILFSILRHKKTKSD